MSRQNSVIGVGFRGFLSLTLALSGLMAPLSRNVRAADADPVAVLGVEASDGAPETVATAITTAMRQRVSSAQGFRLVPGRDLVEVKLIFSCPDEAPSCMAQAAENLGATKLIFGSVKKAPGDAYLVTLKLLDTRKGKIEAYVAEQLTRAQSTGPALRGPSQKWLADLTGRTTTGTIRVTSGVTGASVVIDGLPVGVTTGEALDLPGIAAGRHEVVITKPGYDPVTNNVDIKAGKVMPVDVELTPSTQPTMAATPAVRSRSSGLDEADSGNGMKVAAWSTAGLGALSLVLAIKFGADVTGTNADLDPFRRFDCEGGPALSCNLAMENVGPLDADQIQDVQDIKDRGSRAETLQYVFYGLTAALLGASAYLFYSAYLADDGGASTALGSGRGHRAGARARAERVRRMPRFLVAPTFDPAGGRGLAAQFRF